MEGLQKVSDGFTPISGKCTWWRERAVEEDVWSPRLRAEEKRVNCSCFLEGYVWTVQRQEIASECPRNRMCKYYIRHS